MSYNFSAQAQEITERVAWEFCHDVPGDVDIDNLTDYQFTMLAESLDDALTYTSDVLAILGEYGDEDYINTALLESGTYDNFKRHVLASIKSRKLIESH